MKFNISWIDFDPNVTFSSFTIIHGTDMTLCFVFNSGKLAMSNISASTLGFSMAIRCAPTTTSGHKWHDNETATLMLTFLSTALIASKTDASKACPGPAKL